jgi:hypothetical protein
VVCGTAERRLDGEAERATRRSKGGGNTGVFPVGLRLGLGSRAQGFPFCRAARSILACGPREEKLAGDLGEALGAGEERGKERRRS